MTWGDTARLAESLGPHLPLLGRKTALRYGLEHSKEMSVYSIYPRNSNLQIILYSEVAKIMDFTMSFGA